MSESLRYIVDEKKRVVVCKLDDCEEDAFYRILRYIPLPSYLYVRYSINNSFIGVAKCAPEDKFDPEKGKIIALTRAKAKRCKAINRMVKLAIKDCKRYIYNLEKYGIHDVPEIDPDNI